MIVNHRSKLLVVIGFAALLCASGPALAQVAPPLGVSKQFSVLGNSGVTGSTGAGTVVNGDVGSSPSASITNFPVSSVLSPFTLHMTNDGVVQQAHSDAIIAYNYLANQGPGTVLAAQLDNVVLTSGIYSFTGGTADLAATGTLTLNGPGVFVFQVDSTLTANVGSNVTGSADACNVFWRVGTSATLNGGTFLGNVIADASITVGDGANLNGRALAGIGPTGAVTMSGVGSNTIGGCASSSLLKFFRRGDVDGSGGVNISDPIDNLAYQFLGTFQPTCMDALDDDDNGVINIGDPIFSLSRQFLGGRIWPAPYFACGEDPTADNPADLGCESFPAPACTTGTPDTTPPTVSATVPADGATAVPINQTITAGFSEAMDPLTINTASLMVTGSGGAAVTGTVGYDVTSKIATLTPASDLAPNAVYTATMTTGASDLAGNALVANLVWSFTTAATPAGQAPVALGAASTFAVLAGSTVTNTGATTVNGDLGLSPGTAVTGFPPGTVNGTIHAADPAAAQAQLDLTTAYDDAAGRTAGAITVAGNLGGQTLTPGLYKSTSTLEISSGDLTLDAQGDANAVFIFQMGSALTTTVSRQVILSGGARAANVFWQVGSSATLGTGSVFKGNILALASITVTTGAEVEGRLLARTAAVSLDSNIVK
jgi:hypothetical protein